MLKFEESYFREESRSGFTVCEKMKRAWAVELEVLSEIIRVCRKYGLVYYADYGTLLGAVRHRGFVPWDDDIDIALKRADYGKLLRVLPMELPEGYKISSLHLPGEHRQPMSCVMNSEYINTDPEVIRRFYGCPYIAGVDIYPLDYIPRDKEMAEGQRALYNAVYDMAQRFDELQASGELEIYLPQIEELCHTTFAKDSTLRRQLWLLSERICSMFTEEESDELSFFPRIVMGDIDFRFPKSWYEKTLEMPFENIFVSVPWKFHEILTVMYGDYEVPVIGQSAHDYPFYKKQDEFLQRMKGKKGNE